MHAVRCLASRIDVLSQCSASASEVDQGGCQDGLKEMEDIDDMDQLCVSYIGAVYTSV